MSLKAQGGMHGRTQRREGKEEMMQLFNNLKMLKMKM